MDGRRRDTRKQLAECAPLSEFRTAAQSTSLSAKAHAFRRPKSENKRRTCSKYCSTDFSSLSQACPKLCSPPSIGLHCRLLRTKARALAPVAIRRHGKQQWKPQRTLARSPIAPPIDYPL